MIPMDPSNSQSTTTNQALEAENERLRARIKELESELSGGEDTSSRRRYRTRRTRRLSEETEDSIRDIPSHAIDELDRLARGFSYAVAENLRSTSDVINGFADEVFGRRGERRSVSRTRRSRYEDEREQDREYESESDRDQVSTASVDEVLAGVATGIHESLDMPRRVIERFFDAYEEEPSSRSSERRVRVRTQDEPTRSSRVEVKEKTTRTKESR
jgi:hypothetical protein